MLFAREAEVLFLYSFNALFAIVVEWKIRSAKIAMKKKNRKPKNSMLPSVKSGVRRLMNMSSLIDLGFGILSGKILFHDPETNKNAGLPYCRNR